MSRRITYFLMFDEKYIKETIKTPFKFERGDVVDLVHIFEKNIYFNELSSYSYPPPEQEQSIKRSVLNVLDGQKEKLLKNFPGINVKNHCIFSHIPKETATKFIEDHNVEIAVVATRERDGFTGLFTSSFTEYLCRHAKSDIYVTRHHD